MSEQQSVVVVGAGHAGVQLAASLRERGSTRPITLIEPDPELPYQRPPLSKEFLCGAEASGSPLRPLEFYREQSIELRCGWADSIDRAARTVRMRDGEVVEYGHLVLATGARNRLLRVPSADAPGVHPLRSLADARVLRRALADAERMVVIGGGFIGLEVAAAASKLGCEATVVETAGRVMSRAVSEPTSESLTRLHRRAGVVVLTGRSVQGFTVDATGGVSGVELDDREILPADLVVVGVGVVPNVELARDSGLEVANGIVVDETLLTADRRISAIGDCAAFPDGGPLPLMRLESVQNALDQARFVAARLSGDTGAYAAVPWFWTAQFSAKLQIAGIAHTEGEVVVLGDPDAAFSALRFEEGVLAAVESVNRPGDHMAARRILGSGVLPRIEEARANGFSLKGFLAGSRAPVI